MKIDRINELTSGNQLFAYHANNAGRGTDNCTLQVVPAGTTRPPRSRTTQNVIAQTTTSSWRGDVNLSKTVCKNLGITQEQIL